jgi:hypothetical protein
VGCEGILHYRLHETTPGDFLLSYIVERDGPTPAALDAVVQQLEQWVKPSTKIKVAPIKFLLPEGSGKFVLSYPYG